MYDGNGPWQCLSHYLSLCLCLSRFHPYLTLAKNKHTLLWARHIMGPWRTHQLGFAPAMGSSVWKCHINDVHDNNVDVGGCDDGGGMVVDITLQTHSASVGSVNNRKTGGIFFWCKHYSFCLVCCNQLTTLYAEPLPIHALLSHFEIAAGFLLIWVKNLPLWKQGFILWISCVTSKVLREQNGCAFLAVGTVPLSVPIVFTSLFEEQVQI